VERSIAKRQEETEVTEREKRNRRKEEEGEEGEAGLEVGRRDDDSVVMSFFYLQAQDQKNI
jgi:hypothetical protein